jgi:hypothetical protein
VQCREAGTAWKFFLCEVYRSTAEFLISHLVNLELVDTLQCCSNLGSHDLGFHSLGS